MTVPGQTAANYALTRDAAGNIVTRAETVAGVRHDYAYSYDTLGRLTQVTKDGTVVEAYTYAGPHNARTSETNSLRGLASRVYAYDTEDHLTSAGNTTFTYDKDGFLATKTVGSQTTGYQYSSRGELSRVDLPTGTVVEYVHDPLGRRIAKKVGGTIVEKYLWQGRTRLLAVNDGSGSLKQRFEYADGRLPVAMTKGNVRYFLVYDQVGTLRAVTDGSGGVVKTVEYDSFGNVIADSAPTFAVPFGFAGGLFNTDTGLTRFGFRDYDTDVGRWTAKAPILFEGGDTDLYGYVVENPENGVDPEGTQKKTPCDPLNYIPGGGGGGGLSIGAPGGPSPSYGSSRIPGSSAPRASVPPKVYGVRDSVSPKGTPPEGYKGGRTFENDGRGGGQVLPGTDSEGNAVKYEEYDVNPYQKGIDRKQERIVIGSDGQSYYTSDHYMTFTIMKRVKLAWPASAKGLYMTNGIGFNDFKKILSTATLPYFLIAEGDVYAISDVTRKIIYDLNWSIDLRKVHGDRMKSLDDVFNEFSTAYQFPEYFGCNWDAFNECINDLDWINANAFAMLLLNFDSMMTNCELYNIQILIKILNNTCLNWKNGSEDGFQKSDTPFHIIFHSNTSQDDVYKQLFSTKSFEFLKINMTDCMQKYKLPLP